MQAIIHRNNDGSTIIYNGIVLKWIDENTWIFGFRSLNTKNVEYEQPRYLPSLACAEFQWECNRDYWDLVEI